MTTKELADKIVAEFWQIDIVVVAEDLPLNGSKLSFLIGARWPDLLCAFCLLFRWRKLKRFIKNNLAEGVEFEIVLL